MSHSPTHRLYALAWLSILIAACGGTVKESNADAGATGGSGGTSAAGGTGGGAGATGGTGASTGTGGSGGSAADLAQTTCQAMSALPCAMPDCQAQVNDALAEAEMIDCRDELVAMIECANAQGWTCADPAESNGPMPPSACDATWNALQGCVDQTGEDCAVGHDADGCDIHCTTPQGPWAASCVSAQGSLSCTCNGGSHEGMTFTFDGDCYSDWATSAESVCR